MLTAKQAADCTQTLLLLGERKAEAMPADNGYDADAVVQYIEASEAEPVIPPKAKRKTQGPYNKGLHKQRNQIERCLCKLKQFRNPLWKNQVNFQAVITLACLILLLA